MYFLQKGLYFYPILIIFFLFLLIIVVTRKLNQSRTDPDSDKNPNTPASTPRENTPPRRNEGFKK